MTQDPRTTELYLLGEINNKVGNLHKIMTRIEGRLDAHDERIQSLEDTRTRGYGVIAGVSLSAGAVGAFVWEKILKIFS